MAVLTTPRWRRTGATATTPAVVYVPPLVSRVKIWVDAASLVAFGSTYAAPSATITNAVLTVTTPGGPTGGVFRLKFDGLETTDINFDSTAAAMVTILNALANIDSGDFVGAGGPLPTAITLTAAAVYAGAGPLPPLEMSVNGLTGGLNPRAAVDRTTFGEGSNPAYAYLEATTQETFDIPSTYAADGSDRKARYLYIATVTGVGNYRASGYVRTEDGGRV